MKLKFACADFSFPLLSHDKVLDLIALLEFEGVDIGLFQNGTHIKPIAAFTNLKKNASKLNYKLKSRGLELADIFLDVGDFNIFAINHPDKAMRKKLRDFFSKTIEFTFRCGGKHITSLPGINFDNEEKEDSFKRCCEELEWRCEEAKKSGITFSVEAHNGSIVSSPEKASELIENTPGLTLTLDYSHFVKGGISENRITPLMKYASHFHARGASKDRIQTPVNESTINYIRILHEMKQTGYSGFIEIEYCGSGWENRLDIISETILLRDFIRKKMKSF